MRSFVFVARLFCMYCTYMELGAPWESVIWLLYFFSFLCSPLFGLINGSMWMWGICDWSSQSFMASEWLRIMSMAQCVLYICLVDLFIHDNDSNNNNPRPCETDETSAFWSFFFFPRLFICLSIYLSICQDALLMYGPNISKFNSLSTPHKWGDKEVK